jgi:D-alanine-D-alanine ligase
MKKIRVGIFFGGQSREREVSFAGGRTVYDNLDKSIFEAIPLFIDSFGNIVMVDWQYVYKGSIRDFYPPAKFLPELPHGFQIYAESLNPQEALKQAFPDEFNLWMANWEKIAAENPHTTVNKLIEEKLHTAMLQEIGEIVQFESLKNHIDFAFLALHGTFGEDGSIQGILEWLGIPYSGSGILPSAIGINKSIQKDFQTATGLYVNEYQTIDKSAWQNSESNQNGNYNQKQKWFVNFNMMFAEKMVVKPAHQGSSLGVSVLKHPDFDTFCKAVDLAFFKMEFNIDEFKQKSSEIQIAEIKHLTDLRSGLGLPLLVDGKQFNRPDELYNYLLVCEGVAALASLDSESQVVIESMIEGKEFSCIVVATENGDCLALPPTEIRKSGIMFDYRSKYLPGLSNKVTPIEVDSDVIEDIRRACVQLYGHFGFEVYARIDGFVDEENEIFLNDPNTTSGMMPSSFFFHQAAEIGLNPSKFLTFIIAQSIDARIKHHPKGQKFEPLNIAFKNLLEGQTTAVQTKKKIAVIMGGYSFERHISMESGRNIYEKLSSSESIEPIPLFLAGNSQAYKLYRLPLNMMLKDNADDIREKIENYSENLVLTEIQNEASSITEQFNQTPVVFKPKMIDLESLANEVEGVFIALHGRPGEDGTLQIDLEKVGLYHNGSKAHSAAITINKFETNKKLRALGFLVADHTMVSKNDFLANPLSVSENIVNQFGLPLIAKPADDGCSAAVRKIKSVKELELFLEVIFRDNKVVSEKQCELLGLNTTDEIPQKNELLIEKFIDKGDCIRFLEVTGGMVTHLNAQGEIEYEMFEPSESLAESEILSLEEKFLAGEGQNLTPSRFSKDSHEQYRISSEVRNTLEKVARALDVTGYCRIDAFVRIFADGKVETVIIEINSLPGMTPATCIYHQAALNGYKPFDFIEEILKFGASTLNRHGK